MQQYGAFTRDQALDAGFSARALNRRVNAGALRVVLPCVFADAGVRQTWHQLLWAACAWGAPAAASHRAAGALWRLDGVPPGFVEITTTRQVSHRAVTTHRTNALNIRHLTTIDGIPATSIVRTLIDLATVIERADLECALDSAIRRRLVTVDYLARQLQRFKRAPNGSRMLMDLLDERCDHARPSESPLETRLATLLRRSPLPFPVPQYEVWANGKFIARTDFAYPEHKLAIECDGYTYHHGMPRWYTDLDRRNRLLRAGWRVIHVTYYDVQHRPAYVIALIGDALGVSQLVSYDP